MDNFEERATQNGMHSLNVNLNFIIIKSAHLLIQREN